jgi:betaine-homocysteine S-methyltransferase
MMFREQVTWAAEEGAELIIGETFDHYGEAVISVHFGGLNCHRGPETIIPPLQALRAAGCEFPLAALPVAYQCTHAQPTMQELSAPGKIYSDLDCHTSTRYDFEEFGIACKRLGIQYVGTCCGAAAHHVRALAMAVGKNPEGGNLVPDLKKHFVFGDAEVLENVGNLKGSFLHKQSSEHTKVMSQAGQLRGFASKKVQMNQLLV